MQRPACTCTMQPSCSQLLAAAHDGRISREQGGALLRNALLGQPRRSTHIDAVRDATAAEPLDALGFLGQRWQEETQALRAEAVGQGMQILHTRRHLVELSLHADAARTQWLAVVGLLDALLVIRGEVGAAADSQYTAAGQPAVPLLHCYHHPDGGTGEQRARTCAVVFRGLSPKPECGGPFPTTYRAYQATWGGTTPLFSSKVALKRGSKVVTLQAELVSLATKAARVCLDEWLVAPPLTRHAYCLGLLRKLWVLLHAGACYYLQPPEQEAVYGTTNCGGTHSGTWYASECRQANLVTEHGFPPCRVTYTDMVIASVFNLPARLRERLKKVGTDNHSGDCNWSQLSEWLSFNKSECDRKELVAKLSRSSVCFETMAGEEALLVMDSDGSPDHWDSMEFLTSKEVWESK